MSDLSYSNIQILGSDSDAVRLAIDVCDIGSSKLLARADSRWISVYPFLTEDDFSYLKLTADKLSNRLETTAIGFYSPDGVHLQFAISQRGCIIDEYKPDSESPPGTTPDIALLLQVCLRGTKSSDLKRLFASGSTDNLASQLAKYLGIPRANLCTGYNHLKWAQAGR
jgi:hypothetical protein